MFIRNIIFTSSLMLSSHLMAVAPHTELLINELESLKTEIKNNPVLDNKISLRLAEIYFDEGIKDNDLANNKKYRQRSIELYTNLIGFYQSEVGELGSKQEKLLSKKRDEYYRILGQFRFQRGRLFLKTFEPVKAKEDFLFFVSLPDNNKKLIYDAYVNLAEISDNEGNLSGSHHYYDQAFNLAESNFTKSYIKQKKSWLFYKEGNLKNSIRLLDEAMTFADIIQAESLLKDYVLFLSQNNSDGKWELSKLNDILTSLKFSEKSKSKWHLELSNAFYAFGNKSAGILMLENYLVHEKNAYLLLRLVEEKITEKKWDKISELILTDYKQLPENSIAELTIEQKNETQKTLIRLIIQLSSFLDKKMERQILCVEELITTYLKNFPFDENAPQLLKGLKDLNPTSPRLYSQFQNYAKLEEKNPNLDQKKTNLKILHFELLTLSKVQKDFSQTIESARRLRSLNPENNRELLYYEAKAFYDQNQNDLALEIFIQLANPTDFIKENKPIDQYALLSKNLMLDIYSQRKMFDKMVDEVNAYQVLADKNLIGSKDFGEMKQISSKAEFEQSAIDSNNKNINNQRKALAKFFNFCQANIHLPSSCDNAKILSVKLQDNIKLLEVLKLQKDEPNVILQMERMGLFSKLAAMVETKINFKKMIASTDNLTELLKLSLWYELAFDLVNQKRIILEAEKMALKLPNISSNLQTTLFYNLQDLGLVTEKTLKITWEQNIKMKIVAHLIIQDSQNSKNNFGKYSQNLKKIEVVLPESLYPHIFLQIENLSEQIARMTFYGENSAEKFKKKIRTIENLEKQVSDYLAQMSNSAKIYLLSFVKNAYQNLIFEIENTPVPDALDQETLTIVQNKIKELAQEYQSPYSEYSGLINDLLAKEELSQQTVIKNNLAQVIKYSEFYQSKILASQNQISYQASFNNPSVLNSYKLGLEKLSNNPDDRKNIEYLKLKTSEFGLKRLESYYENRLKNI